MPKLSIVVPTCNRGPLLRQCLTSLEGSIECDHEIVVIDGASTDNTAEVLDRAGGRMGQRLRIFREEQREGFVRAANKGFRAARGEYMIWINDDARPLPGSLDAAIHQLEQQPSNVAFTALFHRWHSTWNVAYQTTSKNRRYSLCHVRGTLYANFPMGKRETYERLGYFDERYYVCAADPDLSLKAWFAGMSVVPAWGALIDHDEIDDERRIADSSRADEDNRKLFEKWELPPKNVYANDFDPSRPCTLKNVKELLHIAAA